MCSIILRITPDGVFIAANRDEMASRAWEPPAEYWPGICGGRDTLAGGTWLALSRAGVMATVLNRTGTLGPAPDKRSRGELPLLALREVSADAAASAIARLDAGLYRPFNMVLADARAAWFVRGLGAGQPEARPLMEGVSMITSGEVNDPTLPRIARHLPRFAAAPFSAWGNLLADSSGERAEKLNIPAAENHGFGTVCATLLTLPRQGAPVHLFAAGPPDTAPFAPVRC
ncbi:MAG: NRDE family protein [Acidocella sp.]|nr:NRDE family protein [Acidocella sp.]